MFSGLSVVDKWKLWLLRNAFFNSLCLKSVSSYYLHKRAQKQSMLVFEVAVTVKISRAEIKKKNIVT